MLFLIKAICSISFLELTPKQVATLEKASRIIRTGGVIAYPTETVYGLGCDPNQNSAIEKLLLLKQRANDKGLIIIAASLEQFNDFIQPLAPEQQQKIQTEKKPTTWLVPALPKISDLLCGTHNTEIKKIAIRISSHPIIKALCHILHHPITSTSANLSGHPTCYNGEQIRQQFSDSLDYIIEDKINENARPSQIIDLISGKIIRE